MTARDMIIDAMNDIDPAFIKEHMDRANLTGFRKFVRYAAPVAIYAAACVAVLLLLPHLIGKTPEKPPEDPSVIVTDTEIHTDTESKPLTDSEDTSNSETVFTESETLTEETETTPTPESELVVPPPETTAKTEPVITPVVTTPAASKPEPMPKPEPKPEPIPEPKYMVHVTDVAVPYSYLLYDAYSACNNEAMKSYVASDPVFTNAEDFKNFVNVWRSVIKEDYRDPPDQILPELDYFNKTFFKTHNLYVNFISEGSGSISVSIDEIGINSDGSLKIDLNRYEPSTQTCDMQYIVYLVAVEKGVAKNTDVTYRYTTYFEFYDSDSNSYYDTKIGIEGTTTYILNKIPEDPSGRLSETVIMKSEADMDAFLEILTDICGGNTDTYFRELPKSSKSTYEKYDLVYIGIYDTSIIYKNGGIRSRVNVDGVLEIIVPAPRMTPDDTELADMSITRLPKNVLDEVKGVKVITH